MAPQAIGIARFAPENGRVGGARPDNLLRACPQWST
jgi:hypothetical protein